MHISKFTVIYKYLTGGVSGVIEYLLDLFNDHVLAKADAKTLLKYCEDTRAAITFVGTISQIHKDDLGEATLVKVDAIRGALDTLASALTDGKVIPEELDRIIDSVKAAIDAFKK